MTPVSTYDWTQFTLRIYIKGTPAQVFAAWTDSKTVSAWFTTKTVIEPRKGGRVYFEWQLGDTHETILYSISKNKELTFGFGSGDERVTVRIKKRGVGCICELHQYGMKTSPKAKWTMHRGCLQGWTFFLANLKSYLEHGIDLRSRDPKMSYRDNFING